MLFLVQTNVKNKFLIGIILISFWLLTAYCAQMSFHCNIFINSEKIECGLLM